MTEGDTAYQSKPPRAEVEGAQVRPTLCRPVPARSHQHHHGRKDGRVHERESQAERRVVEKRDRLRERTRGEPERHVGGFT